MKKIARWMLGTMLTLSACSQPQFDQQLYENFQNPPQEARPRVWWHWIFLFCLFTTAACRSDGTCKASGNKLKLKLNQIQ